MSRRVRARLWGGGAIEPEELLRRFGEAGLEGGQAHPPVGAYRMYAARRPMVASSGAMETAALTGLQA